MFILRIVYYRWNVLLESEQPQHEGICLDANSDTIRPYMLSMHKPACPTCVTVEVNVLSFLIIITVDPAL